MATNLSWKGLAIAGAIFWGVYVGAATLLAALNITTVWFNPQLFNLLMSIYPGLTPTMSGVLVGLLWGAVCGAICGGILAALYNWATNKWD